MKSQDQKTFMRTVYSPDGNKKKVYGFYDTTQGSAAKIEVLKTAAHMRASQSKGFKKELIEIQKSSGFSSQVIDLKDIKGTKQYRESKAKHKQAVNFANSKLSDQRRSSITGSD